MDRKNNLKLVGDKGENLACQYLVKKGFKIMERNCVLLCGEIDIIARKKWELFGDKDKTVHFIEVKSLTSSNDIFFPEQKVDWKKQNKYKKLAEIWLEKNNLPQNYPCQVDIIALSMDDKGHKISFFENVVSA